ncbi:LPS export ABC transporter permease LptG [Novosphingobium sp.]|uniref:LPS export ABC transporter permease LptG n=1 Tax=Novosphingobium sp. TaxID=1874826 RepID=UPI00286E1CA5|nr:LPS export ABC transporter permease LptG [Novosphingobium sp.]
MRLDLFPSRTLTLYLARLFITRIVAVLIMLVLVLQMLDLLGESGAILAKPGNGEAQLWTYVTLRVPQLMARFLPYSVLLATLLTFWPLNQNSEVVSMRAAGLSAHQVLAPLLLSALVVSLISFAFNERVVTRSTATLKAWQAAEYGVVPSAGGGRANVYLRDGENILMASSLTGRGSEMVMTNVTWYRRDPTTMVQGQIRSPRATFAAPGWKMENAVEFDVKGAKVSQLGTVVVAPQVTPGQVAISKVDPDAENIFELTESIAAMKAAGRRTSELEGKWWHKISGPLSAVLMPLLGSVAAFGLARSGQLLIRGVIGMALGFLYFVVDNAAIAIGNFGGYPPLIAAWTPFFLFALVGETVLVRTEE